tara:strand:+ start:17817 stop:18632 length:816 start_codon:yes stop_codon:yes gene_type:complete
MYELFESAKRIKSPQISVVISIFNGAEFLEKSIQSLNDQTYKDFEIIAINDCSTDNSVLMLKEMIKNNRIGLLINNKSNIGLTKSLNLGISQSNAVYIARQDVDDISLPNRLQKQMDMIKDFDLIGGLAVSKYVNSNKELISGSKSNESLIKTIFLKSPFTHSSAFFRRDKFLEIGSYNEKFTVSQDFELWMRFAKNGNVGIVKSVIVKRLVHDNMISRKTPLKQIYFSNKARFMHPERGYFLPVIYLLKQFIAAFTPRLIKELIKTFTKN